MAYSVVETDDTRCPDSRPNPARVEDPERVARILHSTNCDAQVPSEKTFHLDELTLAPNRKTGKITDHDCGNSGGVSVHRTPPSTKQSLQEQSRRLAGMKPNRQPHGAALALVKDLREIRIEQIEGQVVFVLPDGSNAEPGHAVIRLRPELPDGLRRKIRERIIAAFLKSPCVRC